jgi:hypothetical protein
MEEPSPGMLYRTGSGIEPWTLPESKISAKKKSCPLQQLEDDRQILQCYGLGVENLI